MREKMAWERAFYTPLVRTNTTRYQWLQRYYCWHGEGVW